MPESVLLEWMPLFWLVLAIVLAVLEAVTVQLVAIWFTIGCIAAIVSGLLGLGMWGQFAVFVTMSVICLLATRPLVKRVLKQKHVHTNADSLIGKVAIVTEKINNFESKGRVRIAGLDWSARSESGEVIDAKENVLVKEIEGVTLIVERVY